MGLREEGVSGRYAGPVIIYFSDYSEELSTPPAADPRLPISP